jgi:hypothetical protein
MTQARSAAQHSGPSESPATQLDQYPDPPLPEVAEGLAEGVTPETVISYHFPPEALSALPLAWKAAVSPT